MCLKRSENAARVICVLYIYYLCAFFVCAVRVCGRTMRMRTKNAGLSIRWVGLGAFECIHVLSLGTDAWL